MSLIKKIFQRKFIRNSGLQLFERCLSMSFSFISSLFIIRYFSTEDYGVFAYANSYVALFAALTSMGLQSIVIRELVRGNYSEEDILGSSFIIMFMGSLLAGSLIMGSELFTHNNKAIVNIVLLIYCINNILSTSAILNFYFQAKIKTNLTAFAMIIQDCFDFIVKLFLVYMKASILVFALQSTFSAILIGIILILLYKTNYGALKWKASFATIKFLLGQSIPLAISGAMVGLYMRLDQVMLEYYCGLTVVAQYSVGIKLIELAYVFPVLLIGNVMPILIRDSDHDYEQYKRKYGQVIKLFLILALFLTLVFFLFGPYLTSFLYGNKYAHSGHLLRYLAFCIVPVYFGVVINPWIQINYLQKYSLYQTLLGLVVCAMLNFLLIPRYGAIGAVIATIGAQYVAAILANVFFDKTRQVFTFIYQSCR